MHYLASILIGITTFLGGLFHQAPLQYDGPNALDSLHLGAITFPTSLDALTNPGATDSVVTVSHAAQHANANDAIEALEAKLGIGASTATNNTIFVGNGTGSSAFSTSATSTNFLATNLTTASTTMGSSSIQTLIATRATTTDFFVSNIASTTNFFANVGNIGKSTINNLTVTSCTGCSSGSATWYFSSSTAGTTYKAKTLSLSAGDVVYFGYSGDTAATNQGKLSYRISAPNSNSTTTLIDVTSLAGSNTPPPTVSAFFLATTTETVTFERQAGDAGARFWMWIEVLPGFGFSNFF